MILFPFAVLYDGVTSLRNRLYDRGVYHSNRFEANVVAVGNLAIGGTGKSPMIDYLIGYFQNRDFKVTTLSRGYGRKTYGFRRTTFADTPDTVGDEPYMYFRKYFGLLPVFVGEDRDLAISELLGHVPDTDVILLDDAFQHRKVVPSVHIVLTTYDHPFYEDYLLPAGRLRESREGAKRADFIIVTKCPANLNNVQRDEIRTKIARYSEAEVFFMTIVYDEPQPFFDTDKKLQSTVVGISGMANPQPFEAYLSRNYEVKLTHHYRDHYRYLQQDAKDIARELDETISLLTTEKDMVKLKYFSELKTHSCHYVPIRMKFLADEALFLSHLESYLKNYAQDGK